MENRPPLMLLIGAFGGAVSMLAYRLAPIDDLLPLNQALFAGLCGLLAVWLALSVR